MLRGEPAITGLDGSFAPRPRSSERVARQHRCGPPPGVCRASPCRGLDRPVSGRGPVTIRAITPRPSPLTGLRAVGFPTAPRRVCGRLTSPPTHIPRPVFQNGQRDGGPPHVGLLSFPAPPASRRPVSGSISPPATDTFQRSVTLLVRYRTRDVFRVGGWCPPASRGITNPRYSGSLPHPLPLPLRGYHPLRPRTSTGVRVRGGGC